MKDTAARVAAAHLAESPRRMQAVDIERLLADRFGLSRRRVRAAIRHLVQTGEWVYTYEHGSSFLEPSYGRPVRVGERVVLVPEDQDYQTIDREVAVRIAAGASFGSGRHPTTRLAICGIEQVLKHLPAKQRGETAVLDIGTGSGVLVIAAVKLGIDRGLGVDTDPCARFEARQNIRINRLSSRIRISIQTIDKIRPTGRFYLVVANLRPPTLRHLAARICQLTAPSGSIVLSGLRVDEVDRLLHSFRVHGFAPWWTAEENRWAVVACRKKIAR